MKQFEIDAISMQFKEIEKLKSINADLLEALEATRDTISEFLTGGEKEITQEMLISDLHLADEAIIKARGE